MKAMPFDGNEILAVEPAPEGFVSEAERRKERERLTGMLSNGF